MRRVLISMLHIDYAGVEVSRYFAPSRRAGCVPSTRDDIGEGVHQGH